LKNTLANNLIGFLLLFVIAVLATSYIPVQHNCIVCDKPCYTESLLASIATADTDFAHAECSGFADSDPEVRAEFLEKLESGEATTVKFNTIPESIRSWAK